MDLKNKLISFFWIILLLVFIPLLSYKVLMVQYSFSGEQKEVVSFLGNEGDLSENDYTGREVSHLEDVRALMEGIDFLFYVVCGLIVLLVFLIIFGKKDFPDLLVKSGCVNLAVYLIFFVLIFFFFDAVFSFFHKIFFEGGTRKFPSDSNLLEIFPPSFFFKLSLILFIESIVFSNVLIFAGYSIKIFRKD